MQSDASVHQYEQMAIWYDYTHPDIYTQSACRERFSDSTPQRWTRLMVSQLVWKRFIGTACLLSTKSVWSGRYRLLTTAGRSLVRSTLRSRLPGNGYEWIIRGKQLLIIIKFRIERATPLRLSKCGAASVIYGGQMMALCVVWAAFWEDKRSAEIHALFGLKPDSKQPHISL